MLYKKRVDDINSKSLTPCPAVRCDALYQNDVLAALIGRVKTELPFAQGICFEVGCPKEQVSKIGQPVISLLLRFVYGSIKFSMQLQALIIQYGCVGVNY